MNPLILNIPHASTWIPEECFPKDSEEYRILEADHLNMVDWYTDELFNNGIGVPVIAPVSRMVCDTERFRDDKNESMAKIGMGVCYSKTHDLKHSISWQKGHKDWVLTHLYDVHHKNLELAVNRALYEQGNALIIDCHSFSPIPLPYEPEQSPNRPDICIGTDPFHTPQVLTDMTVEFFSSRGYSVKINNPYCGTIVPLKHLDKEKRVSSIMIELNRKLYLIHGSNLKGDAFLTLKHKIMEYQEFLLRFDSD